MKKFFNIFVVSFALVFSTSSFANKIGVIYDSGGKFDKSFNELAYRTALRVQDELGFDLIEFIIRFGFDFHWIPNRGLS